MNICIFCSHREVDGKYRIAAKEFATLLGKRGHTLVWGGTNTGTMKVIADAAQEAGGRIIGVSMELFKASARKNADEMLILPTLDERKQKLMSLAQAFAVLPGGLGTLDEASEVLELKKEGMHRKPIVFLNTDNFYGGFRMQIERMDSEGFLPEMFDEYAHFDDTPLEAITYIETHAKN